LPDTGSYYEFKVAARTRSYAGELSGMRKFAGETENSPFHMSIDFKPAKRSENRSGVICESRR